MRENKKYEWGVGQALPLLDEHSQTKHHIISDYLKRYVEVVMANYAMEKLSMTIVDGFAGGGKYIDALNKIIDGSPFLILQAIKEAEAKINVGSNKNRRVEAEYHFIEKAEPHIDFLRYELQRSTFSGCLHDNVHLYNSGFAEEAAGILARIKKRNPRRQRAIFILDQYSYKDVPFSIVRKVLRELSNGEVILTFNFDAAQSYISDTPRNRKAFSNIQLEKYISWERLAEFKEAGNWHAAIQEQLANAIFMASGAKHITLFFIHPKKGRAYWLVHLSNVYRARDVMMDIHWKHANNQPYFTHHLGAGIYALGYQAFKVPGQNSLELCDEKVLNKETEERCIKALSEELPRHIFGVERPVSFAQLTDTLGSFTVASESQIKSSLQPAIETKELVVRTAKGGVRKSSAQISGSDLIEYSQIPLIFSHGW